jgi:hypothetical protein
MTTQTTIRQCDQCNKEDSINCISGLCPSCNNQNGLFITDQKVLNANSWNLLLKKETAINKYKQQQKELLKDVFEE